MPHSEEKTVGHLVYHRKKKIILPSWVWFIAMAIVATIGYLAGVYHYQIEAAIGPVFGYKAHSGEIDLNSLQETYSKLVANYDGKLDTNLLIQGANRGLVDAAGDTYTIYMSPQESREYNNSLSGNIGGGIGAEIGIRDNKITIIRALSDNAAIKAGLAAGDQVLNINDQSTSGWTVDKAVGQIKGEAGTTVKLTIQRGSEVKDYTITRATISYPSVESSINNGIGILTINRFDGISSETANLAAAAANNFKKQGVKGIVVDLRGNPGGHVNAAVDVAGLWLDNKVVVIEKNGTITREKLRTGSNAILSGIPTVVLVNGSTASASEIVAGALQDYKIAKIVGEKTFGKGSVQQLISLNDGSELKVTVAKWYTPNGKNITKDGINPDISIELNQQDIDTGTDPQLDEALKLLVK